MARVSFFENVQNLIDIVASSHFFLYVLGAFGIVSLTLLLVSIFGKKKLKRWYLITYVILTVFLIVFYAKDLGKLFDNLFNNIFLNLLFPNVAIYITMLVVTNVIMFYSIFSKKVSTLVKILNILMFSTIHFIFIIMLNIIVDKKIDVYSKTSVYTNKDLLSLIEVSMITFGIWIIILTIIYSINKLTPREAIVMVESKPKIVVQKPKKIKEKKVKVRKKKKVPKEDPINMETQIEEKVLPVEAPITIIKEEPKEKIDIEEFKLEIEPVEIEEKQVQNKYFDEKEIEKIESNEDEINKENSYDIDDMDSEFSIYDIKLEDLINRNTLSANNEIYNIELETNNETEEVKETETIKKSKKQEETVDLEIPVPEVETIVEEPSDKKKQPKEKISEKKEQKKDNRSKEKIFDDDLSLEDYKRLKDLLNKMK